MKTILWSLLACAVLLPAAGADDRNPDLRSPKPEGGLGLRVLLYVPGSARLIDYPDVSKILCAEPLQIIFETPDGCVITHQGPYTLIQLKSTIPAQTPAGGHEPRGAQFYDPR